jgi:hypothetical protein
LRLPHVGQSAHEGGKVVSPTHRPPLPPGNIPGTHFCWRLSQPQGHSAAGRIVSMKNSSDTIRNRTRDLPTCSAVPQPTALPRAPITAILPFKFIRVRSFSSLARQTARDPGPPKVRLQISLFPASLLYHLTFSSKENPLLMLSSHLRRGLPRGFCHRIFYPVTFQ